jgi:hypothetical protein
MVTPHVIELGPRYMTHAEGIPESDYPEHFRISDLKQCERKPSSIVLISRVAKSTSHHRDTRRSV